MLYASKEASEIFRSNAAAVAFALNELDKGARMALLGIHETQYESQSDAEHWYSSLKKVLEEDYGLPKSYRDKAIKKLDSIYERMCG